MDARLAWDGENTDISQIGMVWPFESYSPVDSRMAHILDRMNGVATDGFGNNHPIMNFAGEFQNLVNRYYNDTYWNGGPWFLSTMWYGQYYAKRQDYNAGKADIDNHKLRIDTLNSFLGPVGLGAEQIAPSNSLLYPNFRLQAAWPNAWESMSFYVDSLMLFLDHKPDASKTALAIAPKLPTGWSTMTFNNIKVGTRVVNITCNESATTNSHLFTNVAGSSLFIDTYIRVPAGAAVTSVKKNGVSVGYTYNATTGRVFISNSIGVGAGVQTLFAVTFNDVLGDFDHNGHVDATDLAAWKNCATRDGVPQTNPACAFADFDGDTDVDMNDYSRFQRCYTGPTQPDNPECNPLGGIRPPLARRARLRGCTALRGMSAKLVGRAHPTNLRISRKKLSVAPFARNVPGYHLLRIGLERRNRPVHEHVCTHLEGEG
jgi:hypothetical protein